MCLKQLDQFHIRKQNGKYYGWKIFHKNGKHLSGRFFNTSHIYLVNQWIHDRRRARIITYGLSYVPGFHIYTSKKEAKLSIFKQYETVRKVEFREVVQLGKEYAAKVVVAKQMKILPVKYSK